MSYHDKNEKGERRLSRSPAMVLRFNYCCWSSMALSPTSLWLKGDDAKPFGLMMSRSGSRENLTVCSPGEAIRAGVCSAIPPGIDLSWQPPNGRRRPSTPIASAFCEL
jgi:hypothetical protein